MVFIFSINHPQMVVVYGIGFTTLYLSCSRWIICWLDEQCKMRTNLCRCRLCPETVKSTCVNWDVFRTMWGVSKWYEIQNDGLAQRLFSEHCNSIPRPVAIPGGNWIHCTRWCLSWLAKKLVFEFYKPTYKLHYLNILFILQKMPDNYIRIWTNWFPTFYVLFVG